VLVIPDVLVLLAEHELQVDVLPEHEVQVDFAQEHDEQLVHCAHDVAGQLVLDVLEPHELHEEHVLFTHDCPEHDEVEVRAAQPVEQVDVVAAVVAIVVDVVIDDELVEVYVCPNTVAIPKTESAITATAKDIAILFIPYLSLFRYWY